MDTISEVNDHKMAGTIDNNSKEIDTYSSVYLTDISDISHVILNDSQTYIILNDTTAPVENYKCPICDYSTYNVLDFKKHLQANMGQRQCIPEATTSNAIITETPVKNMGIINGQVQCVPAVTHSNTIHNEAPVINIGIISAQSQCTPETKMTISDNIKMEEPLNNIGKSHNGTNSIQVNTEPPMNEFKCPLCEYSTFNKISFKKHLVNNIGQNRTQCIPENIKPNDLTFSNDSIKLKIPSYSPLDRVDLRKLEHNEMSDGFTENVNMKVEGDSIISQPVSSQYRASITHSNITSESNEGPVKHFKFSNIEQKKYKCTYCKKCFDQQVYLSQHLKIHSIENPYKCPTCDRGFISEQYLTRHQKTHTEENSY